MFIGITGYNHESSVALVDRNGRLIDYYREESLSRIKGDKSFPKRALSRIIKANNITFDDIERIAFYERPLSSFLYPIKVAAKYLPESLGLLEHQFRNFKKSSVSCFLDLASKFSGLEKKLIYSDHHLSHTLTSLAYSDKHTELCSVVVDGFGDRSTTSISHVIDPLNIKELWSTDYPLSIGLFYSCITDFLGFAINEGEYKVMGLAAFGQPNNKYKKILSKIFYWDSQKKRLFADMDYFSYHISVTDSYSKKLKNLLGEPRNPFRSLFPDDQDFQNYADIAKAAQDITVEILCKIFEHAHSLTSCRRFLFSGGVAMNSASIETLAELNFVDQLIIPPSPGDAGAAIGSAYYAYLKSNISTKILVKPSLFPSKYNIKEEDLKVEKIISKNFTIISEGLEESLEKAAELISQGEVVGTIIKNNETGPRALGNRSLICNGVDHDAVKKLNTVIKKRSPFRPTAPAMKLTTAKKHYKLTSAVMDSYKSMSATCNCLPENESHKFPVTHIDGTARLQIVESCSFLDLLLDKLKPFGIEIVANSSLNVSGDPTCYDLIDGLMVCARTPLKYLITDLGLLEKKITNES